MIKTLFNVIGALALILAVLGVFLPLLPTTPFVLLASACFLRGSDRLHRWMMANRYFGPQLSNYRAGLGVPLTTKIVALTTMWVSLAVSAWFIPVAWARWLLLLPGIGVTWYLVKMKTLAKARRDQINLE